MTRVTCRAIALMAIVLASSSCDATASLEAAAASGAMQKPVAAWAASSTSAPNVASSAVAADFARGMPYATLRNRMLGAGWLPLRDESCWKATHDDTDDENGRLCAQLPELQSCSGVRCSLRLADVKTAATMKVAVHGPLQGWDRQDKTIAVAVDSWQFTPSSARPVTEQCPGEDFSAFLQAFASGGRMQKSFTAPLVEVAEMEDLGDRGYHLQQVLMAAQDYRGFNLAYADGAFHFVDYQGRVDATPLPLAIKTPSPLVRMVSYRYGTSEGKAYRFEKVGNCWQLAADTQPPTP